jgi:PAS domain S-box-containing protein
VTTVDQLRASSQRLGSHLEFETLISDISASLFAVPLEQLDCVVERALSRVRIFFHADRCALLSVSDDQQVVKIRVASLAEGVPSISADINLAPVFQWSAQRLFVERKPIRVSRMADLPPEAEVERQTWIQMSIRSALNIPIETGGTVKHTIVLNSVREEREWPDAFVTRLRMLGEMLVSALERQKMFAEIRGAEARVKLAADSAEAGLWSLDVGTGLFWASERARAIFGYEADEIVSIERFQASVHPDDWVLVHGTLDVAARACEPFEVEYRITRRGDDRVFWISSRGRAQLAQNGEPDQLMGVSIDITERERTQEALRTSEARLASGIDLAGLGFYELDFVAGTAYIDDRFRDLCGVPPDREQGLQPLQFWIEHLHPDDRPWIMDQRELLHTGRLETVSVEYRYLHPTGGQKWIHHLARIAERDGSGRARRAHGVLRDITGRVRAQDELRRHREHLEDLVRQRTEELTLARDQAQAANQAKSVFLANMSHELRTPLSAILGFSSLLRENVVSEGQRRQLDIINRSGEHLLSLINDLLDVAKIEAGKHELAIDCCDLISLVRDVEEMMRVRADGRNLTLSCSRSPEFPRYVRADGQKLRQVLINLLGNAVKFTEEGMVTLRLSATAGEDAGHLRLRFEVEDTGAGISEQDQARIFEPFIQAGKPAARRGTGLGLTITRRFVEMMGGTLGVESAPGRGSRFTVEVPLETADESEVPAGDAVGECQFALEPDQPECRVLIVEDSPENAMVLGQMLTRAGFRVRAAENGTLGVEAFQQWRPHFIWMDLRMPEMNGAEAARRIRGLQGGHEVKIAAMTASVFASERDEVLAAGMDDIVRKPFHQEEVFNCMVRHLGVRYRQIESAGDRRAEEAGVLRPEALTALPMELRRELADAITSLSSARILSTIDRVAEEDRALAVVLRRLAGRFAYTAILNAVERSKSEAAG